MLGSTRSALLVRPTRCCVITVGRSCIDTVNHVAARLTLTTRPRAEPEGREHYRDVSTSGLGRAESKVGEYRNLRRAKRQGERAKLALTKVTEQAETQLVANRANLPVPGGCAATTPSPRE